eukprot:gene14770-20820_t
MSAINYLVVTPSPAETVSAAAVSHPPSCPIVDLEEMRRSLVQRIDKEAGLHPGQIKLVGVIGSTRFYHKDTEEICKAIGRRLAALEGAYCLVTGGFKGVGETIAMAFHEAVQAAEGGGGKPRLFLVLPVSDPALQGATQPSSCPFHDKVPLEMVNGQLQFKEWGYGKVLRAGSSVREKDTITACLPVMLMLEGGPGSANEAQVACEAKRYVVPVGCTGGAAATFYEQGSGEGANVVAATGMREAWRHLGEGSGASPEEVATAAVGLVQKLHDFVVGREAVINVTQAEGSEANRPKGLSIFNDSKALAGGEEEARDMLSQHLDAFDATYMLNGHGSKNQYSCSEDELRSKITPLVHELNSRHGAGHWCCMYGGDPYHPSVPDVSHLARVLHNEGVPIVAIQCGDYKEGVLKPSNRENYAHLEGGAVLFYPTTFFLDANGLKHIEFGGKRMSADGSVKLLGWSAVIFSRQVIQHVKGHIVMGGGTITRDDCDECLRRKVPLYYIRMAARNQPTAHALANSGQTYFGEIGEWMSVRRIKERQWTGLPEV